MPGRQSHGRPLLSAGKGAGKKNEWKQQTNSKHRKHNLDAFSIASRQVVSKTKGVRTRDLDPELEQKRRRDDDEEEDEDDEDDAPRPQNKKQRMDGDFETFDSEDEVDTDGEGNEFRIGVDEDDDDESIDSDEAFGESDEERFEGYTFRGSSSKPAADDDDDDSLGEDAIDLSQVMDQDSEEDDEGTEGDTESGSEEDDSASEPTDTDDEEDDEDPAKLGAMQNLAAEYAGPAEQDRDTPSGQRETVGLEDLELFGVKDRIKKGMKLMKKEEKSLKPGASKKLDVPLGRRAESKALRIAASEKANETLNRWQDTVKSNRRAEHLVFPLPDSLPSAGLDKAELLPLNQKSAGTELEKTIMSIMEESGLGPSKPKETKDENGETLPGMSHEELREAAATRRRAREVQSREAARAARIKKIKSKAYRRVHRRQRAHEELALQEAMEGEMDSDEEREAQHRRRAMERVGARHKESKWAKLGKTNRRAAWDDEYREGLTEMQRRDEELRRRVDGKASGSDGDDDSGDSGSEDDEGARERLLRDLQNADKLDRDTGRSKVYEMAFMKKAEEAQKKLNDEAVADILKTLNSNGEIEDDSDDEPRETARRSYGAPSTEGIVSKPQKAPRPTTQQNGSLPRNPFSQHNTIPAVAMLEAEKKRVANTQTLRGAWNVALPKQNKKAKKSTSSRDAALILDTNPSVKPQPARAPAGESADSDSDSDRSTANHPLQIKDVALVDKAFGAEDVEADFAHEKADVEEEDDDKIVDGNLPGWGSWVGEGVSKRAVKRDQKRFQKVVKGVKKSDRKDAKLERVIISEKRVRKNDKYLASGLPHEFENPHQYERSLRLPIGPEWQTKETFQDATKPRIILKQGIIAPMAKPMQ